MYLKKGGGIMKGNEIKDAYAKIEEGVDDFFQSDKFKKYLNCMSKFHKYSDRNIILIHSQMPDAKRVAGYQTWKEVGRQVNRGEKSIRILCPVNVMVDEKTDKTDEQGNEIIEKRPVTRFIMQSVYDISQTSGKELPSLVSELTGDVPEFDKLYKSISDMSSYRMVIDDIGSDAKGLCDHSIKTIFIKPGMSQAQTLKTAVHELFHSRVHLNKQDKTREQCEIEAEAAAYVVCEHFGLDTSDYSFAYVASWSAGVDHETRRRCIRGIRKEATAIISAMEQSLEINKINDNTLKETEDMIKEHAVSKLSAEGVDAENIDVRIYNTIPRPKAEAVMYIFNEYYDYKASMKVSGLTVDEIKSILDKGEKYEYLNTYLEQYGGQCDLYEPSSDTEYDICYDLGHMRIVSIREPEKTEKVSAMVSYKGDDKEDRLFSVLNDAVPDISGAEIAINPVRQEEPTETYTERLEKYENLGYDSTWPMVGITYSNIPDLPHYNMNITEAVMFINKLDDDMINDPSKYLKVSIRYTYNDWNYEHIQNLEFGKGRINFIDYLKLPVNVVNHLKTHSNLIEMCTKAENYAPDTTYGQEYGDRMQEWAEYCRMELNHNSDNPVIPRPPLLDDLYSINDRGMRTDR